MKKKEKVIPAKATPRETLKNKYDALRVRLEKFAYRIRYPESKDHSYTPPVNKDGKAQAVSVGELVSIVKAAEVLGYKVELGTQTKDNQVGLIVKFVKYPDYTELVY